MGRHTIQKVINEAQAFEDLERIWNDPDDVIDVNFSRVDFGQASGALVLSSGLQAIRVRRPKVEISASGIDLLIQSHSYLAHVGFFQHAGIDIGTRPGGDTGSSAYLPITEIDIEKLRRERGDGTTPIGKLVQSECDRLAEIITQSHKGRDTKPVSYCLREVIRNAFEHGATKTCSLFAQRYSNRIELSIVDCGRGVWRSLAQRFTLSSDVEALQLAIKPGVSGAEPLAEDETAEWANSGFGLYVLSEVGKSVGGFMICSGNGALHFSTKDGWVHDYKFPGTAVRLTISKPPGKNFEDLINDIIKEGEKIVAGSDSPHRASKSTSTL